MTFANTKTIFWDLDNTLYRNTHAIEEEFNHAIARVMIEMFNLPYSMENALEKARQSFEETGFSGSYFTSNYDLDLAKMRIGFFEHMTTETLAPDRALNALLAESRKTTSNVIITHSVANWSKAVLEKIALRDYFPDHLVLHPEDHNMALKHAHTDLFDAALLINDNQPHETIIVEDVPANLVIPKQMGMKTVLIHHGRHQDKDFDHVDHRYDTVTDFLDDFLG